MSFLFGWFWSDKKVDAVEADEASRVQQSLMKEMKQLFEDCDLQKWAERKYDYDEVYDELVGMLDRIDHCYQGAKFHSGRWYFASDEMREQCRSLAEQYFDAVFKHKQFIEDNEVLRLAVAKKLLTFATAEGFRFDWHYWQLFRRVMKYDLLDKEAAVAAIERTKPDRLRGLVKTTPDDESQGSDDDDSNGGTWDDSSATE